MSEDTKFQIFKREDHYVFGEEGVMTTDPTPVQKAGLERMLEAGVIVGSVYTMIANRDYWGMVPKPSEASSP